MRAERVPQDMRAVVAKIRATRHSLQDVRHRVLRQRLSVLVTEHPRALQMSMGTQRVGEPLCQRHVPQPPALRCRHLTTPVIALDAHLSLVEVHVRPF
jgi:hypothetical protein